MGKKNLGTFAHVAKIRRVNKYRPKWAEAYLSVTAHGDGVFSVADATFCLTEDNLRILIRTAQDALTEIEEEKF